MTIHLIRTAPGCADIDSLISFQEALHIQFNGQLAVFEPTRKTPKRADELLDGGSIYWIIKKRVQCRQKIIGFDSVQDADGKNWCRIFLDPKVIQTVSKSRKPVQGWRYYKPEIAPDDIGEVFQLKNEMPKDLRESLRNLGLI